MLNRMRETIKFQALTVLGKYNLVKVTLVTRGQKTGICSIIIWSYCRYLGIVRGPLNDRNLQ